MDLVKIREKLHQIPELGFEEHKTQKFILSILRKFPKLKIHTFDFTGILVEYKVLENAPFKLFRADLDGLAITEKTGCSFASKNPGLMHACGHDMHITILLGLIEKVIETKIKQNVIFLFQPAEEGKGGAEKVIQTGILENYQIESVFALHVTDKIATGALSARSGIFFANTQEIVVNFSGKSAHVAFPELGKDALAAGADFYLEIQKQIKKNFPQGKKVICAFGKMEAGTAMNAVAASCWLNGTFRAFNSEDRESLKQLIEKTTDKIADQHEVKARMDYNAFYQQVENNEELYRILKKICEETGLEFIEAEKVFTGEDFGFLTEKYKGLLFWLGCRKKGEKEVGLHSSFFLPDAEALEIGIDLFYQLLIQ